MNIVHCIQDFSTQHGLAASLFLAGLAGGFTHCAGMCAPFVLAQINSTNDTGNKSENKLARLSGALLIPYHLGRMTTYVSLAVIFFSVLNLAFLFSGSRVLLTAPILMLAGVLFLVSAFPLFAKVFPWAAQLQMPAPLKLIGRASTGLMSSPAPLKRYALGILLGFMPCGLVIAAIMAASTAPTLTQAAISMAAFSIGTMPALMITALGGRALQIKFPKMSVTLKQGAMAISAIWLFILAGWMMI